MCGIFGYYTFGTPKELQAILDVLFTGLKRLEYRGYDSAGLCIDTAEAPGRISMDGSRRASLDGSATNSPFAPNSNGTPGQALEEAFAAEGKCPDGAEPVIIKCPGKIENLEKMTEQYVKDHVSGVPGHSAAAQDTAQRMSGHRAQGSACAQVQAGRQDVQRFLHLARACHVAQQPAWPMSSGKTLGGMLHVRVRAQHSPCSHPLYKPATWLMLVLSSCVRLHYMCLRRAWTQPRCTATTWPSPTHAGRRTASPRQRTATRMCRTPAATLWWCTTASSQTTRR